MKVRVVLNIELDGDAWAQYQGLTVKSASEIRHDVRSHVLNSIQCSAFLEEADAVTMLGK